MKKVVKFIIAAWLFVFALPVFAQGGNIEIQGHVFDEATGEPIIGANVSVAGEKSGTVSDLDGNFSLRINGGGGTSISLSIRYIGYKTLELDVYEYTEPLEIALHEERNLLSEVVVVGYGVQKRKELTGSVASVSKVALEQSVLSIDGLLGGAISGVNVTQISGQPGAGSEIRIRGGNSIHASNEPLYVIDGFIYFSEKATQAGIGNIESSLNPLASINPSDIESIEILKDVSAKAIYGSRGANGVILVTTKKGKKGGNTIHYQYTIGIDKSAKKINLMNAEQWTKMNRDFFHDTTWGHPALAGVLTETDWQDAVLQTGSTQTHELSISGGDDKTRYLLSGNYTDQQGIIINSGFERFSGRINLDRDVYPSLTVGITASADRSTQNALTAMTSDQFKGNSSPLTSGITNSMVYALFMPPVLPIHNATTGDYSYYNPFEMNQNLNYSGRAVNPVSDLNNSIGQTLSTSLLGNFYANYKIPCIDGLAVKFSAGTNVNYITQNFFAPPTAALAFGDDIRGKGSVGNRQTVVNQSEYLLTYTKQLSPIHYIDLLGGYTNQQTHTNIVLSETNHLENFNDLAMSTGTKKLFNRAEKAFLHSILARANYTLLEKYNLTATWRADKSSRFAKGHQWGHFPSVGFSWNVNDEAFAKSWYPRLSSLKFRATCGTTGNQEIGFSEAIAYFDSSGRYNGEAAYIPGNLGNDELTWETTTEYNAGIDAGFLSDRLNLVADVYYKKTSDLLVKVPPDPYSGSTASQTFNVGSVTNKGFELALNARLIERRKFTWSASANFASNVNTITSLGEDYKNLFEGTNQEKIMRVGESVDSFYGNVYEGVNQATGDVVLRDLNGGGLDTKSDRQVLGSIQPDFTYGFSTNLTWRRWDVFVSLQGTQGNEIYNKLRRHLSESETSYNRSADLLNAWTPEKPTNVPKLDADGFDENYLYSRYVEDASFLKIRNITLGYNLPIKTGKTTVRLRVFASAQNLYTFTNYTGYDPEIAGGIDTGVYPTSRTFLAGAGITF